MKPILLKGDEAVIDVRNPANHLRLVQFYMGTYVARLLASEAYKVKNVRKEIINIDVSLPRSLINYIRGRDHSFTA